MYTSMTVSEVIDGLMAVEAMGTDDMAYDSCKTIAEFYENYEADTGESVEFDPIAIRCEWVSTTLEEAEDNYSIDTSGRHDEEHRLELILDYLQDRTTVLHVTGDHYVMWENSNE